MKSLAVLIAVGMLSAAQAGQVDPLPTGTARSAPFDAARRQLVIEDPSAATSRAWFANATAAVKAPAQAPRAFEVRNRVIVKTDAATAARLAATATGGARPLRVHGYWAIATADVAGAIDLAEAAMVDPMVATASIDADGLLALRATPSDPKLNLQWHLENQLVPAADVNIVPAWEAGYSGAGVVIGVLDSVIQVDHPDLAANYLPAGSSDPGGPAADPHGTAVAGIAAAVGNNQLMGVGAAYNAQFTTHLLSSDSETADALAFRNDLNDVRNNSWGPFDLNIIHHPAAVIMDAIEQAAREGRAGRGTVLVWAAGNGGVIGDRVDYDPYASSRYTLAVGSIGDQDLGASYSERGASLALVTQSDGNTRGIYTTASNNGETASFGGTSAAAPLASGVVALLLEARPDLHWRDVRAVLLDSARQCDPDSEGWQLNGDGRPIHYDYGFGAIDAGAAIDLADTWERLPHELVATTGTVAVDQIIPDRQAAGVVIDAEMPDDIIIETVELILNIDSPFIGDLTVDFTAPSGTSSAVVRKRNTDGGGDLVDYTFTSLRHYGERSGGTWQVKVADRAVGDISTWIDFELRVHGQPVCRLDLDHDGVYGLGDLQALLSVFGACSDDAVFNPAADDDNDGCTSLSDLAELLHRFGDTCDD